MAPSALPRGGLFLAATMLPITLALLGPGSARPQQCLTTGAHRGLRARPASAQDSSWIVAIDQESGLTYYYNEATGESQWEPPQAAAAQPLDYAWQHPHGSNQVLWRVVGSAGTHSRYNLRKHDVQVLSRYNMLKQSLFVSRKQALLSCLADGSATLTSVGKPPTLWRERSGPWIALQKGDTVVLTDQDQVSLDCQDPEGTIFTCQEKSVVQQLPAPWVQLVDQGAIYYSNPQTGETQWDPPQEQGGYLQ